MEPNSKGSGVEGAPQLSLNIDDEKLVSYIETFEKNYDNFDEEKQITERRKLNRKFLFGQQWKEGEYEKYEKDYLEEYLDNVIKEGEDTLRPLVLSRLPDLIVNPGTQSQLPRETADILSDAVNKSLHSDELKKLLTIAFRNHPLDFTAVIKYRWDAHKGKLGDIAWDVIPAKDVKMDFRAVTNDQEDMQLVIHYVKKCLYDWIMLFPKKEKQLKEVARTKEWQESKDKEGRSFELKIAEVWFDWKEKAEDFDPEDPKYEFQSGVLWKAGTGEDSILDKRRNPNWDWEGQEDIYFNGQPIPMELLPQIAMMGDVQGLERKKTYKNYFGRPRKPFIFMGYEQYGEMPLDETSRIEENILLQKNYDIRGMQVTKMIDDSRGKHVFSGLSGLKKETVEAMDLNDPDQDLFVDGKLNEVHAFIQKEQPSQAMFADLARTKDRIKEKLHISGAIGGEIKSDVATTNQIARESGFTIADDISDLTISEVSQKMAEALLHMMKLRYTEDHFTALVGQEGVEAQQRLTNDVIEDGLEVSIKASGVDKLRAERMAKEEASLGLIDPVNYYKDVGRDDPEIRAEMAFLFNNFPEVYFKRFIEGKGLEEVAGEVTAQNRATAQQAGVPQAPQSPSPNQPEQIPQAPQGSPRNLIGRAGQAIGGLFGR